MSYTKTRNVRRDSRTVVGKFRAGRLQPIMAVPVRGNEGGLLSQQVTFELDPIVGRLITPIWGEVVSVFVPVQAMHALEYPESDYAGLTEVIREKLVSGNTLFVTENETQVSRACGVNPRSVSGQKKVSKAVILGHNCAVNFLRQRKYAYANLLTRSSYGVTPAIISQTVLERLNGVLDPDDRINGAVQLDIPNLSLPVSGIGFAGSGGTTGVAVRETDGSTPTYDAARSTSGSGSVYVEADQTGAAGIPQVFAQLNGATAGNVSLTDFYNAETMDRLTRRMRQIVDDNPQYGEEMVLRWAHGLSVDAGKVPFVVYEERRPFGRQIVPATDTGGVQDDVMRSDMMQMMTFSVPIPRTELGGIIITFASVKPDETISSQPCPFLSVPWTADNFVADELALDPVPVTIRELDSDCEPGDENTVALYTGLNQLKATYVHYGLNRALNPAHIHEKTVVWQLELPLSVTPDTILYPASIPQTPFADPSADICTYVVASNAIVQTPMIIGPTPVETLAVIDSADIFEEGE